MGSILLTLSATLLLGSQDRDWSGLRAVLELLTSADHEERVQARAAAQGWETTVLLEGLTDKGTRRSAALALGLRGG